MNIVVDCNGRREKYGQMAVRIGLSGQLRCVGKLATRLASHHNRPEQPRARTLTALIFSSVKAQASSHVDHVVGMYIYLFQNVLRYIKPRLYSTLFSSKVGQTAACARTSSNIECDMRAFQKEVWDSRYAQGTL